MALVPVDVVTVILIVPMPPAGDTAVIEVEELTLTSAAEFSPNLTVAGFVKFVPVIVTDVFPSWARFSAPPW